MTISKWSISARGQLVYEKNPNLSEHRRIVYLEDHSLFRETVINYCIKPFFSNIHLIEFSDGNDAYRYIKNDLQANGQIDLIITDIYHPGMRGNELVNAVRFIEGFVGSRIHIPIMVLSMVEQARYPELRKNKLVDRYLPKSTEAEDIVDCLEEILYAK